MSNQTPETTSQRPLAVEMRGIVKRFPGVIANDHVNFQVRWGEIHALLGENGAGKSTLMSILSGLYQPDEGEIWIDGHRVAFHSPHDAIAAGIGMVHQHFMLVESHTVAENVMLGLREAGFILHPERIEAEVRRIGEQYGLPVDPSARVWQLSVGEQQRVEIIKMLYRGAKILILDEPTAVLTPQEVEQLFQTLRDMVARGETIIFISHKLDEVLSIADRITVLRDGKNVATVNAADVTKNELAQLMVGREILFQVQKTPATPGEPRLILRDVVARNDRGLIALDHVSLTVRAGEIVGIAGVAGNGQTELAEVIYGMRPVEAGTIEIGGCDVTNAHPLVAIEAGVAYVPEDRRGMGSAPNHSVAENLALKAYRRPPIGRGFFIDRARMQTLARDLVARFQIATPSVDTPVRKLSGGNLQKVILAREISGQPKVIIAAYPSRGLDIGATETVHRILLQARDNGTAILLISEDLDEIFSLADTIAVLYEGRVMGVMPADEADLETVGLSMAGERLPTVHPPDVESV